MKKFISVLGITFLALGFHTSGVFASATSRAETLRNRSIMAKQNNIKMNENRKKKQAIEALLKQGVVPTQPVTQPATQPVTETVAPTKEQNLTDLRNALKDLEALKARILALILKLESE